MKIFLLFLLFAIKTTYSQTKDTIYYNLNEVTDNIELATSVRYIEYDSISNKYQYEDWGTLFSHDFIERGELSSIEPEIKDGIFENFDSEGNSRKYRILNNKFVDFTEYNNNSGEPIEPFYSLWMLSNKFDLESFNSKLHLLLTKKLSINEMGIISNSKKIYCKIVINAKGKITQTLVRGNIKQPLKDKIVQILTGFVVNPAIHNNEPVQTELFVELQSIMEKN